MHCTSEALSRYNFVTKHDATRSKKCSANTGAGVTRLAGNTKSKLQLLQQQGAGMLQDIGVQGQLSEQDKRNLGKLGLHESATNTEMRKIHCLRNHVFCGSSNG